MGGNNSSVREQFKQKEEKTHQDMNNLIKDYFGKENEKIKMERNEDFKFNLQIRVYSDDKISEKYKKYLQTIKMEEWDFKYLDDGFSSDTTNELIDIYKKKSFIKKNFDEVLIILIDSYESFIDILKNENKNFLKDFNENLFPEEQPFFLFINKDSKDFEYIIDDITNMKDINYEEFEKICINYISKKKEDYIIEIYYEIEFSDYSIIKSFLDKKKYNNDNFNVILGDQDQEFIYNNHYCQEDDQNNILELLKNENNLIIRNLDHNIKLKEDLEILKEISKINKVKFHFECYKPIFSKKFEEYLDQYELLDKRNFNIQNINYNPYLKLQKYCGYYHEYGDFLIKDNFAQYPAKINIGVCGRAGAGKSTLLNVIFGEKRCLEGQGLSVSTYITSYSHPKYPISLIDFPGFGDKNNSQNLIKKIKEKNAHLKEIKEEINLIIYCIKFGERTFLDNEDNVIYEIIKLKIKLIFVFTKGHKENSIQFKRYKNNFLKDLKKVLLEKDSNINFEKDIKVDIVSIYSMKEDIDGHTIKPFGIDTLFQIIYDDLKGKIVDDGILMKIKNTKDEEKISEIIESSELMRIYKLRKELIDTIRKKVSMTIGLFLAKMILCFPKFCLKNGEESLLSFTCDVNNLSYDLSCIYCKALTKDESVKLVNEIIREIKQFFEEGIKLEENKDLNECQDPWYRKALRIIIIPLFYIVGGAAATIYSNNLKNNICKLFEEKGKINLSSYLFLYGEGINKGINGIKNISEDFKKSYGK